MQQEAFVYVGNVLLSRAVTRQVSSTLKSLTSVFGMGTGVPSLPSSPTLSCITPVIHSKLNNIFRIFRFSFLSFLLPYSLGQALDLLVQLCLICYHTYTRCLSTTQSSWSLTTFRYGKSYLKAGFTLRCFQRLSLPYLATQPCPWQNN